MILTLIQSTNPLDIKEAIKRRRDDCICIIRLPVSKNTGRKSREVGEMSRIETEFVIHALTGHATAFRISS